MRQAGGQLHVGFQVVPRGSVGAWAAAGIMRILAAIEADHHLIEGQGKAAQFLFSQAHSQVGAQDQVHGR